MLSVPLQLFPAVRILENGLFTRSGKVDTSVKWTKNIFRWFLLFFTTAVSSWGAADLDKFVAFVGCFAWFVDFITILCSVVLVLICAIVIQCAPVLCLSGYVALQGLREDEAG
jgi:apolipoprotein N-acyltransferase